MGITITEEMVVEQEIAKAINDWLHKKGQDVFRYGMFIDRIGDISAVIREAKKTAKEKIDKLPHKLPYEYCKTNPNVAPSCNANLEHPRDI